jgi:hypothetical protein
MDPWLTDWSKRRKPRSSDVNICYQGISELHRIDFQQSIEEPHTHSQLLHNKKPRQTPENHFFVFQKQKGTSKVPNRWWSHTWVPSNSDPEIVPIFSLDVLHLQDKGTCQAETTGTYVSNCTIHKSNNRHLLKQFHTSTSVPVSSSQQSQLCTCTLALRGSYKHIIGQVNSSIL